MDSATKIAAIKVVSELLYWRDPHTVHDVSRAGERIDYGEAPPPAMVHNDDLFVPNNPGSARVIPPHLKYAKTAARISDILRKCDYDLLQKGRKRYTIRPYRITRDSGWWSYNVTGSGGKTYRVKVKGLRKGKLKHLSRLDVQVSCSCPYWQWQGPEHHARVQQYQYGKLQGTASKPVIKDPDNKHWACKHVIAVLEMLLKAQASLKDKDK